MAAACRLIRGSLRAISRAIQSPAISSTVWLISSSALIGFLQYSSLLTKLLLPLRISHCDFTQGLTPGLLALPELLAILRPPLCHGVLNLLEPKPGLRGNLTVLPHVHLPLVVVLGPSRTQIAIIERGI